jgi:hypothetical protein
VFTVPSEPSGLLKCGYARYELAELLGVEEFDPSYVALLSEFEDLPPDPYAPGTNRYRRYARCVIFPWSGETQWIPDARADGGRGVNGYYQGDYNPEYVGVVRTLPAFTETALANPLIAEIVKFDFEQTRWSETDLANPLHVGVHLIKLSVDLDGAEAVSSPNVLHQDGEPFVFAHLVYRKNVEGGRNVIATPRWRGRMPVEVPDDEMVAEFMLTKPLESYGVTDHMATHYVSPIRKGSGSGPGERAVILTDFTPMTQRI